MRCINPINAAILAATVTGALLSLPPAEADAALTAQRTISTGQPGQIAQTLKLFYQGKNARLETDGEPVLLYDGGSGVVHALDTARSTYFTTFSPQVQQVIDQMPSGMGGPEKENLKLDFQPTDRAAILAGMTAHQYLVTGTVTFTPSRSERRGRGGGRRRGGGFPLFGSATIDQYRRGEGGPNEEGGPDEPGPAPSALPHWNLSGEIWLSDTLKFPAKEDTLLAAQLVAANIGPFLQPLADALDKHKGLPLLARITVTRTLPPSRMEAAPTPAPETTATTLTVQSVSAAPLSDALFQTPLTYTLIAAPPTPYDPGSPPAITAP